MISHKALRRFYWLVCALAVVGCFHLETKMVRAANTIETTVQPVKTKEAAAPATTTKSRHMRTPINWRKSSETVAYPNLATAKHFWIKVRLKQNRVYLLDGRKLLYTMYCTGGTYSRDKQTGKMKSATPTGTFYAQAERGDSFFNQSLNEGGQLLGLLAQPRRVPLPQCADGRRWGLQQEGGGQAGQGPGLARLHPPLGAGRQVDGRQLAGRYQDRD